MRARLWAACFCLALISVLAVAGGSAQAQQPPTLPDNWQQLSPTDFASLVRQYFEQDTFKLLSAADQESLAQRGTQLFSQIDVSNTPLNYQTLEMLQWVGRGHLDQNVLKNAKVAVMARQDNWAGQPYSEIRAKVVMMMRLRVPEPVFISEARRWVVAGGTLAQVPKNDLTYAIVRQLSTDVKLITGSFSVEWVGQVNVPQSGDYTFFISPIDVNAGWQEHPVNFSMTVTLSNQEIINARPPSAPPETVLPNYRPIDAASTNWVSQSNPVSLTAGTPVTLRVIVTAEAKDALPLGLIHAMLFWQGPGIAKSAVPSSALTQPQNGGPGLQATYTWSDKGKPQSLIRVDPTIDFAWTNSNIMLEQDPTISHQAGDAMWAAMTSPDFIASYTAAPTPKLHPFLQNPTDASSGLSTLRRQAFLNLLIQNPALLDPMDVKTAVRFFQSFRVGSPDSALDAFGLWANRHPDLTSEITTDNVFEGDARFAYGQLAIYTTQQLPGQADRLRAQYLQLPDGRCCLPVAYTLACSYLGLNRYPDWVATLDAKLADTTLVGDLRVNWLLARADAEELDPAWVIHYPAHWAVPAQHPLYGRHYLYQALKSAQSTPVKLRVAQEILARLIWSHQLRSANAFLQSLATSLSADAKPAVAAWQQQVADLLKADSLAPQQQATAAKQNHLTVLKARREQAASAGDSDAVTRYDALINAVTNSQ